MVHASLRSNRAADERVQVVFRSALVKADDQHASILQSCEKLLKTVDEVKDTLLQDRVKILSSDPRCWSFFSFILPDNSSALVGMCANYHKCKTFPASFSKVMTDWWESCSADGKLLVVL